MKVEPVWTCPKCNRVFQYVVPGFTHRCTETIEVQNKVPVAKDEVDTIISKLKMSGIDTPEDAVGAGDLVAKVLKSMGITPQKVQQWLGLEDCGCSRRQKWLNSIFSVDKSK